MMVNIIINGQGSEPPTAMYASGETTTLIEVMKRIIKKENVKLYVISSKSVCNTFIKNGVNANYRIMPSFVKNTISYTTLFIDSFFRTVYVCFLRLPNNYFDIILCPFILHRFPTLDKVFSNFAKWSKQNGYIILLDLNGSNPVNRLSKIIRHFLEFIFNKEFVISYKLATPNETDHSVTTYINFLRNMGCEILFFGTNHFPPKKCKTIIHRRI